MSVGQNVLKYLPHLSFYGQVFKKVLDSSLGVNDWADNYQLNLQWQFGAGIGEGESCIYSHTYLGKTEAGVG